ncbi:MAG: SRPBCC domain-containing protein [Ahrensia sp.]|nr:SRPBCC domain-containing protein [Ahrensia sp.]
MALTLAVTGRKTFEVELVIPAPPAEVWRVLMDTSSYGEWNPVFTSVTGDYVEGGTVENRVVDPKGNVLDITASVDAVQPHEELRQSGGLLGVLTFDHRWLLEEVEGGTKVTQYEVDRGLYVWFWDSSWILPSYAKVNQALRDRMLAASK